MVSEIMIAAKGGILRGLQMEYLTLPPPNVAKDPNSTGYLTDNDKEDILILVTNVVPRARHWAPVERMMNDGGLIWAPDLATLVMGLHDDLGRQLTRFATKPSEGDYGASVRVMYSYLSTISILLVRAAGVASDKEIESMAWSTPIRVHIRQRLRLSLGNAMASVIEATWLKPERFRPRACRENWGRWKLKLKVVAKAPFVSNQSVLANDILEILQRPHLAGTHGDSSSGSKS